MPIIRVDDLSKTYLLGDQEVTALEGVSLTVEEGVFMAIAGPSGSGKSTLLNIMGCIDTPSKGRVEIEGKDLSGQTPDDLADVRARTIGFIFQTFNLLPVLSAFENVEYPLLQMPELSAQERKDRVSHYLSKVGLTKYAHHRPNQLSGGQRQRVAIARALACESRLVVLDEPTSALDVLVQAEVLRLLADLRAKRGLTFLFITHDLAVVRNIADRVAVFRAGRIVECAPTTQIFQTPSDPYTRRLISAVPVITEEEKTMRDTLARAAE